MALAGNIKEFGLADIFQIVSLQQKTGILTVESSKGRVTVLLEKGMIVGADASFRPIEERLEQTLVQSQQLTKFQLKRATENQKKTHQPLWTALAELGDVDAGSLQRVLSQQIHETIYHLLRWTEGDYRFDPRKNVEYDHNLVSPVNTEFLVMEGFRITDEWSEFEKEIPSFHIMVRRNPEITAPPADLSDAEAKIFRLLETDKSLQELIDIGQLGEFDTCQTVHELMKKHVVERVPGKKSKKVNVRQPAFDFREIFSKAAVVLVTLGVLAGGVFALRFLPANFALIQIPQVTALRTIKPFIVEAHLYALATEMSAYALSHGKSPASLTDLVGQGRIRSRKQLKDAWEHPYTMQAGKRAVIIRSAGPDGTMNTDDDLTVAAPF
jgi:competence protein ComGC